MKIKWFWASPWPAEVAEQQSDRGDPLAAYQVDEKVEMRALIRNGFCASVTFR